METVEQGKPRWRASRARILEQALSVFSERGLSGLNLGNVGEACGMTRPALYRYFDSKEGLVGALAVVVIDEVLERATAAVVLAKPRTPLATLMIFTHVYQRFAERDPAKFSLLSLLMSEHQTLLPSEKHGAPAIAALERALAPISAAIDEAQARKQLDPGDAGSRAAVLLASVHGSLNLRKQAARSAAIAAPSALCELAVTTMLRGWGASPSAIKTAARGAQR